MSESTHNAAVSSWPDIDAQIEQAHEHARQATSWREHLEHLAGEGRSARGEARVSVGSDGSLTGIVVSDALAARGGRAVAEALIQALTQAQEDLRAQAGALTDATWGAQDPAGQALAAELAAATPKAQVGSLASDPETQDHSDQGGTW